MRELKTCPFCGSNNTDVDALEGIVGCGDCLALGPAESDQAEAVNAWNRRREDCAEIKRLQAEVERLKQENESDWAKFQDEDSIHWKDLFRRQVAITDSLVGKANRAESCLSEIRALPDEWDAWLYDSETGGQKGPDDCAAQLRKILEKYQ